MRSALEGHRPSKGYAVCVAASTEHRRQACDPHPKDGSQPPHHPLARPVDALAERALRLQLGLGKDAADLVFSDEMGRPLDPDVSSKRFRAEVTAIKRVTFHALRHTPSRTYCGTAAGPQGGRAGRSCQPNHHANNLRSLDRRRRRTRSRRCRRNAAEVCRSSGTGQAVRATLQGRSCGLIFYSGTNPVPTVPCGPCVARGFC